MDTQLRPFAGAVRAGDPESHFAVSSGWKGSGLMPHVVSGSGSVVR